jgi:hypothetical protein
MFSLRNACIALVVLLLSACQSRNEMFEPSVTADSSNAVVHLYRPEASTPGLAKPLRFSWPEVLVDDKPVGVIKYNEYISFRVAPGTHRIRVTGLTANARDWELRDIKQEFRARAGSTNYLRLKVEYRLSDMNVFQPKPSYQYWLTQVSEDDAIYEIRKVSPAN